ncbi:uncharacterized protein LOC116263755 isoform X2 [Nymphaea colorata]|uniref:uncharacterized protein LOC116263755 isoform X2 n=1 Tax=Nymphaea colorata TaxID=210225 RepID=UPI00129D2458|nr:uncharacterized protein LOC116263755 isoform X2 [Nymphaea colorata]
MQLEETKSRLNEYQSKVACLRRNTDGGELKSTADHGSMKASFTDGPTTVMCIDEIQPQIQNRSRSQLISPEARQPTILPKGREENKGLIPVIRSLSAPCMIHVRPCTQISSQHKRKLRSLALNPIRDEIATSDLDGIVKLWKLQSKGSYVSLLSSTDCLSSMWKSPDNITWHPNGDSVFAVYSADDKDSQVSILNFNSSKESRVTFLEERPHHKGVINHIEFMPWSTVCFVTGGDDHSVILWNEKNRRNIWKPELLHRNIHSSAVMGFAGMSHKHMVVSSGADKQIIGFDVDGRKTNFKHQMDSECMGVLPNPLDFNLLMVQTRRREKQLRLFDMRVRPSEIHAFGWKQVSTDSQSALIGQAWSPDGMYITSGSPDPVIHIFDIRYNSSNPAQSVKAHQKRVLKAVWHHHFPVLISVSSDFHIGLHRIR